MMKNWYIDIDIWIDDIGVKLYGLHRYKHCWPTQLASTSRASPKLRRIMKLRLDIATQETRCSETCVCFRHWPEVQSQSRMQVWDLDVLRDWEHKRLNAGGTWCLCKKASPKLRQIMKLRLDMATQETWCSETRVYFRHWPEVQSQENASSRLGSFMRSRAQEIKCGRYMVPL